MQVILSFEEDVYSGTNEVLSLTGILVTKVFLHLITFSSTLLNERVCSFTLVLPAQNCAMPLFPLLFVFCSGRYPPSGCRPRADGTKKGQTAPSARIHGWLEVSVTQFLGFAQHHHLQILLDHSCF